MVSTSFLVMPIVYHVVRALSTQLNKNLEKMFSLLYNGVSTKEVDPVTLGDVIAKYRAEHSLSMDKFAERSGISKTYISMLEHNRTHRGKEPTPSIEVYRSVAQGMGIDVDELIRTVEGKIRLPQPIIVPDGFEAIPDLSTIPLVGQIACGEPILAEENIEETVSAPAKWHADFALTCKGDSMAPTIQDGDLVAIRIQPEVETGEIAAVRIGNEATLKRVYLHPDYIELRPENPAFESIIRRRDAMNDVRIEGKAVGICRGL